jgi:hypothetical protein
MVNQIQEDKKTVPKCKYKRCFLLLFLLILVPAGIVTIYLKIKQLQPLSNDDINEEEKQTNVDVDMNGPIPLEHND